MGKSKQAIIKKAERLGLEVVKQQKPRKKSLTSSLELPKELPSVEEALKILAGALTAAAQPGLDKVAVSFSSRNPIYKGGTLFVARGIHLLLCKTHSVTQQHAEPTHVLREPY